MTQRAPHGPAPGQPVEVRRARIEDAEAVRAIYNREVLESTAVFDLVPRTLEDQRAWLADREGAYAVVVAALPGTGGPIVGFGALSPYRTRPAYATTVEDSVYVERGHHRRGVGRALLEELVRLATAHGFHSVIGRVVDANAASIALHRACDFEVVGTEREVGRKFGRWLDVVVLQRLL